MRGRNWCTLDNTAKVIPSTTTINNTNVFRLSCTLKKRIDKKDLEKALNKTIKEFPLFRYTLKKGLFWHYLEKTDIAPKVYEETRYPCSKLDSELLFKVIYNGKRINLEVYHALSDGNGAMEFLKYLVCTYISIHEKIKCNEPINGTSEAEKSSDDFKKFNKPSNRLKIHKNDAAYKFKFSKNNDIILDVIEAEMSVDDIKKEAKKYDTTVTIYLSAILIKSIIKNARVRDLKKPIGISLPVDLRRIFSSNTSRNFFYTVLVQYKSNGIDKIDDIIKCISKELKEKLEKKYLQDLLNNYMILQKIIFIRVIPIFIKDLILGYSTNLAKTGETMVLSNLGVVSIPNSYSDYIDKFSAISNTENIQLSIVSYKDKLTLGFTSHLVNKEIERTMIGYLNKVNKDPIKIITNIEGNEHEM